MAYAYSPRSWELLHLTYMQDLERAGGYYAHMLKTVHFATQLVIAGIVGFIHAFVASLVPFVAEEVGAEVCVLARHLQSSRVSCDGTSTEDRNALSTPYYHDGTKRSANTSSTFLENQGTPYAFSPHRWIWVVDGKAHVKFSGGSYSNHGRFACWASGQWFVGAACGYVHAFFPMLLPNVHESVALELGGLIINRRKLRNLIAQEKQAAVQGKGGAAKSGVAADEVALVNPENLSDYFSESFKRRFEEASLAAEKDHDVGDDSRKAENLTLLAQGKVKVQIEPGAAKKFL